MAGPPMTTLVLATLLCSTLARDFSLVGYLPEWRHEGADFDRLAESLTHLVLFSVEVSIFYLTIDL